MVLMISRVNEIVGELNRFRQQLGDIDNNMNEEETIDTLVKPVLNILGYRQGINGDIKNQVTLGRYGHKGNSVMKLDLAIVERKGIKEQHKIYIECKRVNSRLEEHIPQLVQYYNTNPSVKLGILTDGIVYMFFTDGDAINLMDSSPFMKIDLRKASMTQLEDLASYGKGLYSESVIDACRENQMRYKEFSLCCRKWIEELRNKTLRDEWIVDILENIARYSGCKEYDIDELEDIFYKSIGTYNNSNNATVELRDTVRNRENTGDRIVVNSQEIIDYGITTVNYVIDSVKVLGVEYNDIKSFRQVIVKLVDILVENRVYTKEIISNSYFKKGSGDWVTTKDCSSDKRYTRVYNRNLYVMTKLSIEYMMKFIIELLRISNNGVSEVVYELSKRY